MPGVEAYVSNPKDTEWSAYTVQEVLNIWVQILPTSTLKLEIPELKEKIGQYRYIAASHCQKKIDNTPRQIVEMMNIFKLNPGGTLVLFCTDEHGALHRSLRNGLGAGTVSLQPSISPPTGI